MPPVQDLPAEETITTHSELYLMLSGEYSKHRNIVRSPKLEVEMSYNKFSLVAHQGTITYNVPAQF